MVTWTALASFWAAGPTETEGKNDLGLALALGLLHDQLDVFPHNYWRDYLPFTDARRVQVGTITLGLWGVNMLLHPASV